MIKSWRTFACTGALLLLAACGGGSEPAPVTGSEAAASQLRQRTLAALSQAASAGSTLRVQAISTNDSIEALLDFAEARFPDLFPSHQATLAAAPFRYRHYRHYRQTGVYVGVVVTAGMGYELDGVYVMGGVFGPEPAYVGQLADLLDSDGDGIGDAADAVPRDALCSAASDAADGVCHLRAMAGARIRVVGNGGGKLFFSAEGDALLLYAYDLKTGHFTGRATLTGFAPTAYAYSVDHGRLYVGDATGTIHAYGEALERLPSPLARIGTRVGGLTAAGKYLVVQDESQGYVFDRLGVQASRPGGYLSLASTTSEWSPAQSRLYYLHFYSPPDLIYMVVDQGTGRVTASGQSPYHGDYKILAPIRANPSGSRVLLGSGDLYAAPALTWAGKIAVTSMIDAMWLPGDELLVASASTSGVRFQRFGVDRMPVEVFEITGGAGLLALAQHEGRAYIVSSLTTHVDIRRYVPSNDTDRDGVDNTLDKFPLDPAASVDSDSDGHPDAWHDGLTQAGSTTGLTLDAYPQDAACHAVPQGNGSACDPAFHAPVGVPDRILGDGAGTVFMFSKTQGRIYRWSAATGNYIPPLAVGQPDSGGVLRSPRSIVHSADHRRIYLGYDSGQITFIDAAGAGGERLFSTVSQAVGGLGAAGNFLLVQDYSGIEYYSTHSVFDRSGVLTDTNGMNYFSHHYEWSPSQGRLYFIGEDTSPKELTYEVIDQASGKIVQQGRAPRHGEYEVRGPLHASPGGGHIVLGNGDIYSTADLAVVKSFGAPWVDARWLGDGRLVGLSEHGTGARLTVYGTNFAMQQQHAFEGAPKAVIVMGGELAVVTELAGAIRVTRLTP